MPGAPQESEATRAQRSASSRRKRFVAGGVLAGKPQRLASKNKEHALTTIFCPLPKESMTTGKAVVRALSLDHSHYGEVS
jgi:hypothetical protein